MRVETFLTASAAHFGDKTALIAGKTRMSYRQLDAMSDSGVNVCPGCDWERSE